MKDLIYVIVNYFLSSVLIVAHYLLYSVLLEKGQPLGYIITDLPCTA
jgi:hypothetical protein